MVRTAKVFMILAGLIGLPAAACSSTREEIENVSANDAPASQAITRSLKWLTMIASIGSLLVGSLARPLGRVPSGVAALLFAGTFLAMLIQGNALGLAPSILLLIAAVLIFVAPKQQFWGVTRIE